MLTINIHNDGTGTDTSANYTYVVRVNDEVIETGSIFKHNRSDGWRQLVRELVSCADCKAPLDKNGNCTGLEKALEERKTPAK
jgi:hypothetical protein